MDRNFIRKARAMFNDICQYDGKEICRLIGVSETDSGLFYLCAIPNPRISDLKVVARSADKPMVSLKETYATYKQLDGTFELKWNCPRQVEMIIKEKS